MARLHGVVDFNKSCRALVGQFLPLAGVPVWYHRYGDCGFLFTAQFDGWDAATFRRYIYNDDYIVVDPEAAGARAQTNAVWVARHARGIAAARLLDYGGGDGTLARLLNEQGMIARSWDPMHPGETPPPDGGFDLVTAFEVLEHTPTPVETCRQALSLSRDGGQFLFSTLTMDKLPARSCDHWYIAPRNGHISLHTSDSLRHLAARLGRGLVPIRGGTFAMTAGSPAGGR